MKATKSRDGRYRVTLYCPQRIDLYLASLVIADALMSERYTGDAQVDSDVSRIGKRRMEDMLRDGLAAEGKGHAPYLDEKWGYEDGFEQLQDAVKARLIEVGIFPKEEETE